MEEVEPIGGGGNGSKLDGVLDGAGENNLRNPESNVPACLTIIRTLSRGLEKEPLVLEVLFWGSGVGDGVRLVVFGDEI